MEYARMVLFSDLLNYQLVERFLSMGTLFRHWPYSGRTGMRNSGPAGKRRPRSLFRLSLEPCEIVLFQEGVQLRFGQAGYRACLMPVTAGLSLQIDEVLPFDPVEVFFPIFGKCL